MEMGKKGADGKKLRRNVKSTPVIRCGEGRAGDDLWILTSAAGQMAAVIP